MERKEFELILKRALELQSLQKKKPEESDFTSEDLESAASRLGIKPEILEKAISETGKKFKRFHLSGSPDDVREAFLKHFLMQETNASQQYQPIRIDHDTIKIGTNSAIRIFHPHSSEIEALVEFSDAKEGGTNITWSGNSDLGFSTKLLVGGAPFLVMAMLLASALVKGITLLPLLPVFLIFLLTSRLALWGMQKNAQRLEETLSAYFQNCQTIDEIESHKSMKKELEDLKASKVEKKESAQTNVLQAPLPELSEEATEKTSPGRTAQEKALE